MSTTVYHECHRTGVGTHSPLHSANLNAQFHVMLYLRDQHRSLPSSDNTSMVDITLVFRDATLWREIVLLQYGSDKYTRQLLRISTPWTGVWPLQTPGDKSCASNIRIVRNKPLRFVRLGILVVERCSMGVVRPESSDLSRRQVNTGIRS